jgi:hypothetical protein
MLWDAGRVQPLPSVNYFPDRSLKASDLKGWKHQHMFSEDETRELELWMTYNVPEYKLLQDWWSNAKRNTYPRGERYAL